MVISVSQRLAPRAHDEWLAEVCRELKAIWPAAGLARLLQAGDYASGGRVFDATRGGTFPAPAADAGCESRPGRRLDIHRLARYDGRAVRSGRLAVDALLNRDP